MLHASVLHLTAHELQLAAAALKERMFSAENTVSVGFKYLNISSPPEYVQLAMRKTRKPVSKANFQSHSKKLSLKLKKYRKSQPTLI